MMGNCKECGCLCNNCNTNSLDLHHDIEVLNASLKESRLTISNLKKELKVSQEMLEEAEMRHQKETTKYNDRYDILLNNHRRLEVINHNLEDKILALVQDYDSEKEATMEIHEEIHRKLKAADKRVEDVVLEKDTLAAQCRVVMDLLRKCQTDVNVNKVLGHSEVAKEVSKLNRNIEAHEDKHPMISDSETNRPTVRTMPMSTFPPCAMMFDPSPKPIKRDLMNVSPFPRILSDSRLANMAAHPTSMHLCASCKDVSWVRTVSTQTPANTELINRESFLASQTYDQIPTRMGSRIFDV
ncbi:hypothetical protein EB796_007177 [Bugula neritina]|uniref:Uncharacterized protein n=1 Tax=Bugula neritina TaxID=10212 RepID=A0A7J7K9A3_BUGNE|nr:hypothetical protein EB796_007177 [Bugula neritina]